LLPDLDDSGRQEIERFRSDLFKRDYLLRVRPFPGVGPLFERLHADGVRIVLATSAGQEELDHHRRLLERSDLVHATVSKDDVDRSKPCPDIFEAALGKVASVEPEAAVVVGDTPWDMEAAGRTGLKSVAVLCGGFPEDWLKDAGAVAIFAGPEELLAAWPGWLDPT
jgi:HAD superfamily hydrolase (TIGR01509 family)